jgi:hypothetical protein
MPALHLAAFSCDVTPPLGHPLCGGWIEPARGIDDPLEAVGVVLLGPASPVVLCAVDWVALRNDAHQAWRVAIARAAHTTPERVAVQCVHPHNTPFADPEAARLALAAGAIPCLDLKFFERVTEAVADAVRTALKEPRRVTHLGLGQARVEQVASNRRILGPDDKVKYTRTSAAKDPKVREEPEGLIDPFLKTLSFRNDEQVVASLHYYATHPMSYYGDGRVSADFCGLARRKRAAETKSFQVYFTGCAGNVTAGKYNDGARENRVVLRDRVHTAMAAASKATEWRPLETWEWRVEPLKLPPRREASFGEEQSRRTLADEQAKPAARGNAAFQLAWLKRLERPIDVSCLDLGRALVLHLPGEPFVEYQLKAQELRKERFVCVAGYGDGGPGYIPTDVAYLQGGYEPTVALAAPSEGLLTRTVAKALQAPQP